MKHNKIEIKINKACVVLLAVMSIGLAYEGISVGFEDKRVKQYITTSVNTLSTIIETNTYGGGRYTVNTDELYVGESEVVQEGKNGIYQDVIQVEFDENGSEISRKLVSREIVKESAAEIVHIGTKERPEFILPLDSYNFTSGFGSRSGRQHKGIDLCTPTGTEVHAACAGTVVQAGWNGSYGYSVRIDNGNGMATLCAHMSETLVQVGDVVEQGEVIGLSGSTGDSTAPHVHFEIIEDGVSRNPWNYVSEK